MNVKEFVHARLAGQNPLGTLAVVAEDSGQKWVISAGMASRLEAEGIQADIIGGSSGGGLAMLYYAFGQTREGTLCLDSLSSRGFYGPKSRRCISLNNLWYGKSFIDMDTVIHDIFTKKFPVQWQDFSTLNKPMFLTYTTKEGEAKVHRLDGVNSETAKVMALDTTRFPLFAGSIDKNTHFDGGFANPIPVQTAIDLGATHVIALRCANHKQPFSDKIFWYYLCYKSLPLARLLRTWFDLRHAITLQFSHQPHVLMVKLVKLKMNSSTSNPKTMMLHALMGWDAMGEALGLPPRPYPKIWQLLADELGLGTGREFA